MAHKQLGMVPSLNRQESKTITKLRLNILLLNQHSPVPRARSSIAGKDATQAQIYVGLGTGVATRKRTHMDLCRFRNGGQDLPSVLNLPRIPGFRLPVLYLQL